MMMMIMPQPGGTPPFVAQVGARPEGPMRSTPAIDPTLPDQGALPPGRSSAHAPETEAVDAPASFAPDGWRTGDAPPIRAALRDVRRVRVMLGVTILVSIGLWFLILKGMQFLF